MSLSLECPLVSIVVLSYNSEKYIQETLDSIYCQTYPKIELVLADDCSCDKTVDIIKKFIETSSTRFSAIKLLESPHNAGTSANCNKGEMACVGDWIKVLAADDILLPDCIQKYVTYLIKHPDANFIFSKVEIFGENDDFVDYFDYSFFSKSRNEQLHQLIFQGNCIPAPSAFFRTEYVRQLGITNDERVPLIEDLPKWINLLNKGTEFSFIDDTLVKYRTGGGYN